MDPSCIQVWYALCVLITVLVGNALGYVQVQRGRHYGAHLGLGVGSSKPARKPYFEFFATECSFPEGKIPHKGCYGSKLHIFYNFSDKYRQHDRVTFKPKTFVGNNKGPRFFRPEISADHLALEKYLSLTTYKDTRNGWYRPVTWFIRANDGKWTRPTIKKVDAPDNATSSYGHSISVLPGDPDNGGVLVADKGRAFLLNYGKQPKRQQDLVSPLPDSDKLRAEAFGTSVTQPFGFYPLVSQPGKGGRIYTIEKQSPYYPVSYIVREFIKGPWYDEQFGKRMVGRWRNLVISGSRKSGRGILQVYRQIENASFGQAYWSYKHDIDPQREKRLKMKMREPPVFDVSSDYIAISLYRGTRSTKTYREFVVLYKLQRFSDGNVRFIYQGKVKDPRYKDNKKNGLYEMTSNEFGYSVAVSDTGDVFVGSPNAYSRVSHGKIESKGCVDLFLASDFTI